MYYEINEVSARRAKEMNSYYEYVQGSATAAYRGMVDKARKIAESQKDIVDPMYHDKIDKLLDTYCRKLAGNINRGNEIETRCPSIMIAGPSNFPARKKEKQNAARHKNMEEWSYIQGLLDKIKSIGTGGISSDDPNAIDKLREKLAEREALQTEMKLANAYYRKHKTLVGFDAYTDEQAKAKDAKIKSGYSWENCPFPAYTLSNNNANMKRIRERIASLEKRAEKPLQGWKFEGGEVVANSIENRLQILFDEKPDEATRTELKRNGFRWAPSQKAWQRQLTNNAIRAARAILVK